jgi:peptidyl-prolyl cis-trans isomerase SDCCAG10
MLADGNSNSRKEDIERMQEDLRMLKKRRGEDSDSDSDTSSTRARRRKGPSYLEQELAKYSKGRGRAATRHSRKGRRDDDDDLMRDLDMFSKKVLQADDDEDSVKDDGEIDGGADLDGVEVDNDVGWMKHALKFVHQVSDETRRAEDEYTVSLDYVFLSDDYVADMPHRLSTLAQRLESSLLKRRGKRAR